MFSHKACFLEIKLVSSWMFFSTTCGCAVTGLQSEEYFFWLPAGWFKVVWLWLRRLALNKLSQPELLLTHTSRKKKSPHSFSKCWPSLCWVWTLNILQPQSLWANDDVIGGKIRRPESGSCGQWKHETLDKYFKCPFLLSDEDQVSNWTSFNFCGVMYALIWRLQRQ